MENKFGKVSKLILETKKKEEKAILNQVSFTAPFKVMQPFYITPDYLQVMVLSASAGIMEGDEQYQNIRVGEKTNLEFITQAYEKIHKMKDGYARRKTEIVVEKDAFLFYHPMPTIPFADSAFESELEIVLEERSSQLIYEEILSCGRIASGETFKYRYYHNLVSIKEKNHLIYRDNSRYEPDQFELSGMGMYEGFTHLATLLFFHMEKTKEWLDYAREFVNQDSEIEGGVTRIDENKIVVRILGKNSWHLQKVLEHLRNVKK